MSTKIRLVVILLVLVVLLSVVGSAQAKPSSLEWPSVAVCLQENGTVLIAITNVGDRVGRFGFTPLWIESHATDSWTIYRDLGTLRAGETVFSVLSLPTPDTSGFLWIKTGDVSQYGVLWRWRIMSPIVGPYLTPCPTVYAEPTPKVLEEDNESVEVSSENVVVFGPLPCDPSTTSGAVLVTVVADTELFWSPGMGTGEFININSTAWRVGVENGYAVIVWSCATYYVPVNSIR